MKITAIPELGPTFTGPVALIEQSAVFVDGAHHTDDDAVVDHFEAAGWPVNRAKLAKERREWAAKANAAGYAATEGTDVELDEDVANDRGVTPLAVDLDGDPDQPADAQE